MVKKKKMDTNLEKLKKNDLVLEKHRVKRSFFGSSLGGNDAKDKRIQKNPKAD